MKKACWCRWILLIIGLVALFAWRMPIESPSWEQPTMGTLCHITLSGPVQKNKLKALRADIDTALEDVNRRMSTWQADTEISQFNTFQGLESFAISPEFAEVVQAALSYAEQTGGAFDPTVKPLVDHWGFGMSNIEQETARTEVSKIMNWVGWEKVHLEANRLRKDHPNLQLDLSAIAKGYGVDRVGDVIRAAGLSDFLVEIGGEIVADGNAPSGGPWRVGIESPESDKAFGQSIFQALELSGWAMATSGDYRNFRVRKDGTRYSHIIDPRTGKPAESDIAAVTVLAKRCMDADAIATALFVMGSEKSFQWLSTLRKLEGEKHPGFEAFFILHDATESGFSSRATPGFPNIGKN
jgi:thiamine biosynthesis lipoprotein